MKSLRSHMLPSSILLAVASALSGADVRAAASPLDRAGLPNESVPPLAAGVITEDGGDVGALSRAARAFRLTASLNQDFTYQSNAALASQSNVGDFVAFTSLNGVATYDASDKLTLELSAALQSGVYADLDELDFWGVFTSFTARRRLLPGLSVYAGAEAYDYQSLADGDSLARAFTPKVGISHILYLAPLRTYVFSEASVKHHFSKPASDERDELNLSAGLSRHLVGRLHLQGRYEYRFSNYEDGGRRDQRHRAGVSAVYFFSEQARADIGVGFTRNDSNVATASYRNIDATLGGSLTWKF